MIGQEGVSVCAAYAMAIKKSVVVRNVEEVKGDVHASNKNFLSLGEINHNIHYYAVSITNWKITYDKEVNIIVIGLLGP